MENKNPIETSSPVRRSAVSDLLTEYEAVNFSEHELTKGFFVPSELHLNIIPTVSVLQTIREKLSIPITVNSGYRAKEYNKAVGGRKNSLHMVFNAIDFKPEGYYHKDLKELVAKIEKNLFETEINWNDRLIVITPQVMGIGLYETFIHLDTRGLLGKEAPARWVG